MCRLIRRTVHPKAFIGLLCLFLFWAHIGGLAGFGQTKDFFPFRVGLYLSVFHSPLFVSCFGKDLRGVETYGGWRHTRLQVSFCSLSVFRSRVTSLHKDVYKT